MATHRPWAADEDLALREACRTGAPTAVEIARLLQRSRSDVRGRVRALGLTWSRVGTGHRWSPAEDATVRRGVRDGLRPAQISALLERRSTAAVAVRVHSLGLAVHGRRWLPVDDSRLRLAVEAGDSIERIAADLERTREAIRHRCRDLGIGKPRPARDLHAYRPWSERDEQKLLALQDLPLQELARRLGRSEAVVRRRLLRLGATRPREGRFVPPALGGFSHGEDRVIERALRRGTSLEAVAARLGRGGDEVRTRAASLAGGLDIILREGLDAAPSAGAGPRPHAAA